MTTPDSGSHYAALLAGVRGLPTLEQSMFRLLYIDGIAQAQACSTLQISESDFAQKKQELMRSLKALGAPA
jgi:hypothetical protein